MAPAPNSEQERFSSQDVVFVDAQAIRQAVEGLRRSQ